MSTVHDWYETLTGTVIGMKHSRMRVCMMAIDYIYKLELH